MNANKGNFYFSGLQNIILYSVLIALSFVLISSPIFAQGSQGVIVRVTGFDPVTNVYNFSCITPAKTPASNMANEKYFDIDPNPSFYPKKYNLRSPDDNVTWHLDPLILQKRSIVTQCITFIVRYKILQRQTVLKI